METSSPADSQGATMLAYFSHWLKQVERGGNSVILYQKFLLQVFETVPGVSFVTKNNVASGAVAIPFRCFSLLLMPPFSVRLAEKQGYTQKECIFKAMYIVTGCSGRTRVYLFKGARHLVLICTELYIQLFTYTLIYSTVYTIQYQHTLLTYAVL